MTYKVLVIEDHREIAELVKLHLKDIDCRVKLAFDGPSGLADAEANKYDLIILDLMLPGESGLEICRRLRGRGDYTPILMLTSRSTELDRVLGLEMGADDYLTKPFSVMELLARVKAIFRRVKAITTGSVNATTVVRVGDMTIDADQRSVAVRGRSVELTAREFDLLLHLARNPGRVYTREQLLDFVWGYNHSGYQHTVNSHINRLRSKIEDDPANPVYVRTVWGVGYKFSEAIGNAAGRNP
ncbi:MAG TPA: response regulator transcription factor [Acetobacteraceae bacterium]|nr:response regulator transcription factor [Acetobacteraceae bacterium]